MEKLPQTVGELFYSVRRDAQIGMPRDSLEDSKLFVELAGVKYKIENPQSPIEDKPILILANHPTNSIFRRQSIITTLDTFTTSALIIVAVDSLNQRETVWLAQADLPEKWWIIPLESRKTQHAAIKCHGHIPVYKNNSTSAKNTLIKAISTLRNGRNLAVYPEGHTGRSLGYFDPKIPRLIDVLQARADFQILPTSVFRNGRDYIIKFGKAIDSSLDAQQATYQSMIQIAQNLPPRMRGYYSSAI